MDNEIVIKLPKPTARIKLIPLNNIKRHYSSLSKNVPLQWINHLSVEIEGTWYAVISSEEFEGMELTLE